MSPSPSGDPGALAVASCEAFSALDVDALRGLCSNDVALTVDGGRRQGVDEFLTCVADLHRHFPGFRTDVRVTRRDDDACLDHA